MMRSLRSRLLIGMLLSSAIVLASSGLILYSLIRSALFKEFDDSLGGELRRLTAMVENERGVIRSEMSERELPQFARRERPDYYQLWINDGSVLERSRGLAEQDLPRAAAGTLDRPELRFVVLPDGRPGQLAGVTFVPHYDDDVDADEEIPAGEPAPADTAVTLVVARDIIGLQQTLARIRLLLIIVLGGAILLALPLTASLISFGLTPLRMTAGKIAAIDHRSLSTRLVPDDAPSEVRSVISRLNDLLQRLHEAFQRERAFSANVAHEFRTPLAGLRTQIEVALSADRDVAEYRETLGECLKICKQTEGVTENLLALARVDAGQYAVEREPVEIDTLLREIAPPLLVQVESRGVRVDWNTEGLIVDTDRNKLRLILRNLIDNAVSYTPANGRIRVATEQSAIIIANTHSGLSLGELEQMSDRFWRAGAARSETGIHSGLGLSLCRSLIELIGGRLTLSCPEDRLFQARLEL